MGEITFFDILLLQFPASGFAPLETFLGPSIDLNSLLILKHLGAVFRSVGYDVVRGRKFLHSRCNELLRELGRIVW